MSDRPKWMPSIEDVQEQSDLHLGWADEEAMDFIYSTGLRAQIEALGDLHQTIVTDEDGHDPDIAFEIEERIEALSKELASE